MTTEKKIEKRRLSGRKIVGFAVFALAALLLVVAIVGYAIRETGSVSGSLKEMRSDAVVHIASEGMVDKIARDAKAARLKELRANGHNGRKFREIGLSEVESLTGAAEAEARAEAEALYSNPVVADPQALTDAVNGMEERLAAYGALRDTERQNFAGLYVSLVDSVGSWTELTDAAGEDDEALFTALCAVEPKLSQPGNAPLKAGFVRLARDMADTERARRARELETQLIQEVTGEISDWTELAGLKDAELWDRLCNEVPALAENPAAKDAVMTQAKANIETALAGGEVTVQDSAATEGNTPVGETQANYRYFVASEPLAQLEAEKNAADETLWEQLTAIIPNLTAIQSKDRSAMLESIEKLLWPGELSFTSRFQSYSAEIGSDSAGLATRLAGNAENLLLLGIALALLAAVFTWWDTLTGRFGVPRIIILLFFLYLILAAQYYNISIPLMMGNVLERMVMYGILALAMMPGIQCGIGLNMGMTIGCIAGLLGIVLSLQFDMTGAGGLVFACMSGAIIALPLGWAYSILLNRMKGNEMTISTYVGFSFVSLMCIAWMLLPFSNPKIIWLLSGQGLRVTHSLLGSYGHLLDRFLSFELLGMRIPTGGLLFVGLCCLLMWLFSRTRVGIAMTAAGSNPRFAEASGINVNSMRSLGTILSTVFAAIGIVIYSQSFGYAQLYTAPRQLGFIAASAILIGGASVRKARVGHVILGVFLFEGVLVFGQQIANSAVAGGGLSEVMRIMISNGIILYALTQTGGGRRE